MITISFAPVWFPSFQTDFAISSNARHAVAFGQTIRTTSGPTSTTLGLQWIVKHTVAISVSHHKTSQKTRQHIHTSAKLCRSKHEQRDSGYVPYIRDRGICDIVSRHNRNWHDSASNPAPCSISSRQVDEGYTSCGKLGIDTVIIPSFGHYQHLRLHQKACFPREKKNAGPKSIDVHGTSCTRFLLNASWH
jgi:hypothetical protein